MHSDDHTLRRIAREALDAHDALRGANASEPALDEDGIPYDRNAWQTWRNVESGPAYKRWDRAMDALSEALGEPDMSRHPYNFRPVCEEILS